MDDFVWSHYLKLTRATAAPKSLFTNQPVQVRLNWPQGHKAVFMLDSTKHEILTAHKNLNVQWLSGRVLDSRPRGHGFQPHRRHCVVSLSKTH